MKKLSQTFGWMALVCLVTAFGTGTAAAAAGQALTPVQQWKGSLANEGDEALIKESPACITSAKTLAKVWQAWKIRGPQPEVDFAKHLVIVTTTRGGTLNLSASLDDKGNLTVSGMATRDLRPGFRYVIATVSREGVKTVNGQALPKE